MANFTAFFNAFGSQLIVYLIFIAVIALGAFIGITLAKARAKNADARNARKEEKKAQKAALKSSKSK